MSFSQLPATIAYPPVQTGAWVVISRLSETAVGIVPSLDLVNHSSQFALPLPSGTIPKKVQAETIQVQAADALGRPLYDDGMGGTPSDVDGGGNPLPPKMVALVEESLMTLRDRPEMFTLTEVLQAVLNDFLAAYPFYDYGYLVIFDDRVDSISTYQGMQNVSGLASAAHPLFMGPVFGRFDVTTDPGGTILPRGHLFLVAPDTPGVNYYCQIRHGVAGAGGGTGPLATIAEAAQQGSSPGSNPEVFYLPPFANTPVTKAMLTDNGLTPTEVSYFWLRSEANGLVALPTPIPTIPFLVLLGRSTGATTSVTAR